MSSKMSRFWNNRADENAFFFVDTRTGYRTTDVEAFWSSGERDLDILLSALGGSIVQGNDVVEIGCGVGRLTRVIAVRAATVRALDVSQRMLDLAAEYNPSLDNVEWLLGDGSSLSGIESGSADVCISHVVFQHIPDPEVTLSYVRDMGRILRPGGWSAFQISNDPRVHAPRPRMKRVRDTALAALGRFPSGQHDRHWLGSMIELDDLRVACSEASMAIERVVGAGTQYCCVLTRRV